MKLSLVSMGAPFRSGLHVEGRAAERAAHAGADFPLVLDRLKGPFRHKFLPQTFRRDAQDGLYVHPAGREVAGGKGNLPLRRTRHERAAQFDAAQADALLFPLRFQIAFQRLHAAEGQHGEAEVRRCAAQGKAQFPLSGRGTVATGRVERGVLNLNEKVEIVGLSDEKRETTVTGIEMFHKLLDYAEAGDNIGALLRGVDRNGIERGQVLAKPGSIHPHTKFKGQVYVLTKDEGGRHTPFFNNYRPQFYFRTTDVTGVITLPEGTEMCMPGDNVEMSVELITPIAIEKGLRFAIREGGRTVGSGAVTEIAEA